MAKKLVTKDHTQPLSPAEPKQLKPPIVLVKDIKTYRAEDIPDEYLAALAKELNQ